MGVRSQAPHTTEVAGKRQLCWSYNKRNYGPIAASINEIRMKKVEESDHVPQLVVTESEEKAEQDDTADECELMASTLETRTSNFAEWDPAELC